ncbi:hypothetical protein C4D60_Mb03t21740 [Musa balbisiana]|uniref:Uncharacterized protein n=1 Tax=Musa balbisiana TaxID=52838 RepID=A0A4S8JBP9_MUSBA|nr:hypothetical protein C4D60_Mb03t21740 [Musa balbisiana]
MQLPLADAKHRIPIRYKSNGHGEDPFLARFNKQKKSEETADCGLIRGEDATHRRGGSAADRVRGCERWRWSCGDTTGTGAGHDVPLLSVRATMQHSEPAAATATATGLSAAAAATIAAMLLM